MQSTWVQLFAEVNHSADELYALCEGHADEGKCLEAVDMFERCRLGVSLSAYPRYSCVTHWA